MKHDITVRYLYYWSKQVLELAQEKNIKVINLEDKRANRKEVEGILKKQKPGLVFFNGHGNNSVITGHNNEILIAAGKNEELLGSKIVYALSCQSAKQLGRESIKKGTLGYIGYDDDFIIVLDENKISDPLRDKTAALFLEPSNRIMISLIKGNKISDVHHQSQEAFRENVAKVASSETRDNYLIPYLLWDMQHQVCLGNREAKFD